jgi:hypothetical protein
MDEDYAMLPKEEAKYLKPKHQFSVATRLQILKNIASDIYFLQENLLLDYEIELTYFKPEKVMQKKFKNVYQDSRGELVCEITIRNFIPKDLISNFAKQDLENP